MGGGKSRAGGVRDFLKWPSSFLLLPPATAAAATISEIMEVNPFDDGGSEHEVPPLYNTGVSGGPKLVIGNRGHARTTNGRIVGRDTH